MLQDYIEILEHIGQYSESEFLGNPERYGSAERFLQLALESVLDMGSHVIADEALGTVHQIRDIPVYSGRPDTSMRSWKSAGCA